MADEASAKIEDAIVAVLTPATAEGEPLENWIILTEQSRDIAFERVVRTLVVSTPVLVPQIAEEQNQTFWQQTVDIAAIDGPQAPGMVSRTVRSALATVHALLAADRTLGGRLQDLQEIDLAGTEAEGKDVHGASVQYRAEFYTPRDDWFTILGHGGATF